MNVKAIFIVGSSHPVNYWGEDVIWIGCKHYTIAKWQEMYAVVGIDEGYRADQITEYKGYIDMIAELHKIWGYTITAKTEPV